MIDVVDLIDKELEREVIDPATNMFDVDGECLTMRVFESKQRIYPKPKALNPKLRI